jgi:hypothetical protein
MRDVGLSTAAITIGSAALPITELLRAAGAQEAVPTAPELAAFAETVELAAAALYGTLRPHLTRPAAVTATTTFAKHHTDAASAVGPLAGDKRVGKPNQLLLPTLNDQLREARSENDVIRVAYDLENSMASTYLFIIDLIDDPAFLRLASSILPVDAQHAVVLGVLIGRAAKVLSAQDKDQLGYESEDKHLDPAAFPPVVVTSTSTTAKKGA